MAVHGKPFATKGVLSRCFLLSKRKLRGISCDQESVDSQQSKRGSFPVTCGLTGRARSSMAAGVPS